MPYPREVRGNPFFPARHFNEVVRSARDFEGHVRELQINKLPEPEGFWAKILGEQASTGLYAWDEVYVYDGEIVTKPGGKQGRIDGVASWTHDTQNPAREINGMAGVPVGCYVWLMSTAPSAPFAEGGTIPEQNYKFLCPDLQQLVTVAHDADVDGSGAMKGHTRMWNGSAFVDAYECWVAAPGGWGFFTSACVTTSITTLARWIGKIGSLPLFLAANATVPPSAIIGYDADVEQALTHNADGCWAWVDVAECE